MTAVQEKQLNELLNKQFTYKGKVITILSFKDVAGTTVIKTDGRTIALKANEIETFLSQLVEYVPKIKSFTAENDSEIETLPSTPVNFNYEKTPIHKKLEKSLSEMIDKVVDNKKAVPQARALCDIANSMINLEKQQINFLKATKQIG